MYDNTIPQTACKETQFQTNEPPGVKVSAQIRALYTFARSNLDMMRNQILIAATALAALCFKTGAVCAQNFGIGFQVGDPTGLNLHFRNNTGAMRPDILFAWDVDDDDHDFFFVNVHGLWFKRLGTKEPFNFFYGPGAFAGVRDYKRKEEKNRTVIGFSGNFGLNYEFSRLDIFIQLTPRLSIMPGTDFDAGGGLGLRFFL